MLRYAIIAFVLSYRTVFLPGKKCAELRFKAKFNLYLAARRWIHSWLLAHSLGHSWGSFASLSNSRSTAVNGYVTTRIILKSRSPNPRTELASGCTEPCSLSAVCMSIAQCHPGTIELMCTPRPPVREHFKCILYRRLVVRSFCPSETGRDR